MRDEGRAGHAATRAGGADLAKREALLKYILHPAVAQERIVPGKDGLVRITLKRAFSDGTIAIGVDPLSLLSRLAAAGPYPRFHTVRCSGVLASASTLRPKITPKPEPVAAEGKDGCVHPALGCEMHAEAPKRGPYRPWAELLKRTFTLTFCNAPNARVECACLQCSQKNEKSVATCAVSAKRPSCQHKPRQGRLLIGRRAHSKDESSETRPRSQPPTQTRKQRAKASLGPMRQNATTAIFVP